MNENKVQSYEDIFYEEYKRIRNRFRQYNPYHLYFACIDYLHYPVKDDIEELQKHPWFVLLLLKWIFSDQQFSSYNKKELTQKDFIKILQMMRDLGGKIRMPSEYSHHTLFFRNIAYQQFVYQLKFNIGSIARQIILFKQMNDRFNFEFEKITGITINAYLELSVVILPRFVDNSNYHELTIEWFGELRKTYSDEIIQKFLQLISLNIGQLHQFFLDYDLNNKKKKIHEFYEQTPLLKYPLIAIGNKYTCIYKNILFRNIEHFIYDILKLQNAESFMSSFGHVFERYVEKGLLYASLNFLTEKDIEKQFKDNKKVVDFVIKEESANIFIDAKAVEMSYMGKVTHNPNIISDKVKDSIIKAIEQSYETVNRFKSSEVLDIKKENYLIVITYKELYLGNGNVFYETVAKNRIDKILSFYSNIEMIPLENIYFITINEFDYMVELVNKKRISITEILQCAKKSDSNDLTRRFDFYQHLVELKFKLFLPEYLKQENENIIDSISKKISNKL